MMHLLLLLALGTAAYAVLVALGFRWQSVKPAAAVAPPVPAADSPEEGNHA